VALWQTVTVISSPPTTHGGGEKTTRGGGAAEPAELAWGRGSTADSHRHIQPRLPHTEGVRKLPGAEERQSLLSSPGGVALWQTVTVISSPPTTHAERGEKTTRSRGVAEPAQLAWRRGPVADSHCHIQPAYHTRRGVRKLPREEERQSLLSSPGGVALWQTVTVIFSPPTTHGGGEKTTRGRACSARLGVWPCGRQSPSYPAHLPHTQRGVRKLPGAEGRQSLLSSPGG
jgi:hypothetical protein